MGGRVIRLGMAIAGSALLLVGHVAYAAAPDRDLKLKKGARAKLCVECHDEFAAKLKRSHLHTPLSEGDCTGCHDPHTSNNAMLLAAESGALCYECHDEMDASSARSVHEVFAEGKCAECHDPHASDNENNLLRTGSALCFECHKEMGEKIASNEYAHDPVEEDCLECHSPHYSEKDRKLLVDAQPGLCLECHEVDDASFKKRHKNYPVETGRCSLCHDPHGSSTEALLFDNVHDPVAGGECDECHMKATSKTPLALKDSGYEICEGCHYEDIADMLIKPRVHWALLGKDGCVNCHAPHGSANEGLLKDSMISVCATCHADTIARQARAKTKHEPIAEGECIECHSPHGSENLFILNESSPVEVCGACHDWEAHSTHPIGEKVIDPRNPNVTVSCLSCHRSHGTEYKHFIYFQNKDDLCVQCHTDYRR